MGLVINTEHKFMFIHVPKTGGELISGMCMRGYQDLNLKLGVPAHLQVLYDPAVRATRDYLCGRSSEAGHWRYKDMYDILGAWVNTLRIYAMVRNPWDKMVSAYHYDMRTSKWLPLGIPSDATFDVWLDALQALWAKLPDELLLYGQHTYLVDAAGQLPANLHLLRFENFVDEVNRMYDEMGFDLYLPPETPKHNASVGRRPYQEYYTDETRNLIGQLFATDVRLFGYSYADYERFAKGY